MKAIILSGGKGTRLWPLTADRPKPLVPFMGEPLIFRIIRQLIDANIQEIVLTLGYLGEQIRKAVTENDFGNRCSITFYQENTPLGTAGSVLKCKDFVTEDTLIISGDCVIDENLRGFIHHFTETDAPAAIATTTLADPREFGTILTDTKGQITAFIEKPIWEQVRTDRVNTGIYIIRPSVVSFIQDLNITPCDFGKDVFPEMLRQGLKIQTYAIKGYWCDIGSPESYLKAHQMQSGDPSNVFWTHTEIDSTAKIENSVLGDNVRVGKNVILRSAYVGSGTVIEDGASIIDAKIDAKMRIAKNAVITGIISKTPDHESSVFTFDDAELVGTFSYAFLSKLCRVIAMFFEETDVIAVVHADNPKAATVGTWMQAGLMASGREVRYGTGVSLPAFRWMIREGICDGGVYVWENRIKILNGHGNDLNLHERKKLHHLYEADSGKENVSQFYGGYPLDNPEEYYYSMLMKHFPVYHYDFSGMNTDITKSRKAKLIAQYIIERFPDAPIFVSQYSGYLAERYAKKYDRYVVYCGNKMGDLMDEMEHFMHIPGVYEQYLMYTDEFAFCLGICSTKSLEEEGEEAFYAFQADVPCKMHNSIHLLGKLCNQYGMGNLSEEGCVQRKERGNVHIAADQDGGKLRLYVESFNEEYGKELIVEWENRLKDFQ